MAGRDRIVHLLRQLERAACRCPAHSNMFHQGIGAAGCTSRKTDYAFEISSSNIRYGPGVSREIGMVTKFIALSITITVCFLRAEE
ncbi:Hydroxyacid-oxoacid transhydrogenase, mitochondrial [Ataeniobius toweri]|uniref:Hydroxyacid-oxoacid transhydrogenase, mitochondrial n=1 Tax=Ataeniobius toweri TaxID=208326 RepID=A0ABU7B1F2_9TELE|nr:Hydroxyacid-oxoacid transhydrogenase, mitochondrial [Ataeniobius toweri]